MKAVYPKMSTMGAYVTIDLAVVRFCNLYGPLPDIDQRGIVDWENSPVFIDPWALFLTRVTDDKEHCNLFIEELSLLEREAFYRLYLDHFPVHKHPQDSGWDDFHINEVLLHERINYKLDAVGILRAFYMINF